MINNYLHFKKMVKLSAFGLFVFVVISVLGCAKRKYIEPAEYKNESIQNLARCYTFLIFNNHAADKDFLELRKYHNEELDKYENIDNIGKNLSVYIMYADYKYNKIPAENAKDNFEYNINLHLENIVNDIRKISAISRSRKVYLHLIREYLHKNFERCIHIYDKIEKIKNKPIQ